MRTDADKSLFLRTLNGKPSAIPPLWFMRQAGRYLPEYREVRARAGSFLDLCYNPALAAEVTLQPIRRFDLDAAILFADILLIPHALGQNVSFVAGEGPRLDPVVSRDDLERFRDRDVLPGLAPVMETVSRVRSELSPKKALIGFAGAPLDSGDLHAGRRSSERSGGAAGAVLPGPRFHHRIDRSPDRKDDCVSDRANRRWR